jgi:hydroxymethylbilane synthase
MLKQPIILGTRGSELALWQAHHIQNELQQLGWVVEIKIIKTKGDKIQDLSFDKIEGKGFFTKELQDALLSNEIDMAVHSHKDLETTQPEGLLIAAVTKREEANEVLIIKNASFDQDAVLHLTPHAIVGTSSIRRKMIIGHTRSDIEFVDLRGNVPTRIQKLRDHTWDAIVLAKAGINRIAPSLEGLHAVTLDPLQWIPAPAQGALAIECRSADIQLQEVLKSLHHMETATAVNIERSILRGIGGGCQVPLSSYAFNQNGTWHVHTAFTNSLREPMQHVFLQHAQPDFLVHTTLETLDIRKG